MNKDALREKIQQKEGNDYFFVFNGSRNQVEKFSGTIIETYPSVFLVETREENPRIKSFSYNPILRNRINLTDFHTILSLSQAALTICL